MLYHRDVYFKDSFKAEAKKLIHNDMRISAHCMNHVKNVDDKHKYTQADLIKAVKFIATHDITPFEVEVVADEVTKACYRLHNKITNDDICIVLRDGLIVTAWKNASSDKHFTLDTSKYARR